MGYEQRIAIDRAFDAPPVAPVDIGPGYDRLAEAMDAEGIKRIRRWRSTQQFSVEMDNGYIGVGRSIREAIENAAPVLA